MTSGSSWRRTVASRPPVLSSPRWTGRAFTGPLLIRP
ncbi:hypothetical protein E2C01_034243 [Portunus trituberculatus]|uniref:Uncharacterized protein n=1 Tax=Portunus trituberculatus TaxID=210409 RepID=A0A5B7F6G9_PORTR|nr:hypothetical protein [Portunus trituberculatus]